MILTARTTRGREKTAINEMKTKIKSDSLEEKEITVEIGDTVEVIGGAFKGEEAKVNRVDDTNREVTIELLDAAVPIPTTVDIDMVRKKSS